MRDPSLELCLFDSCLGCQTKDISEKTPNGLPTLPSNRSIAVKDIRKGRAILLLRLGNENKCAIPKIDALVLPAGNLEDLDIQAVLRIRSIPSPTGTGH